MDRSYIHSQRRRALANASATPSEHGGTVQDARATATAATDSVRRGLTEALTGVVRMPWQGAKRDGAAGFVKGIGKGAMGLLAKPLVGVVEGASQVMHGVHRSTAAGTNAGAAKLQQHRRKRRAVYGPCRVLRPYSADDALAVQYAIRAGLGGDAFVDRVVVGAQFGLLLFSIERLAHFAPHGELLLVVRWASIEAIEREGNGVYVRFTEQLDDAQDDEESGRECKAVIPCNPPQIAKLVHTKMLQCWAHSTQR